MHENKRPQHPVAFLNEGGVANESYGMLLTISQREGKEKIRPACRSFFCQDEYCNVSNQKTADGDDDPPIRVKMIIKNNNRCSNKEKCKISL